MTRKNRASVRTIVLLMVVAIAITLLSGRFVCSIAEYGMIAVEIQECNDIAQVKGYEQEEWPDSLKERYDNLQQEKSTLIKTDDVAAWIYYSAYSVIGKVLRLTIIILMLILYGAGIGFSFLCMFALGKRAVKQLKRLLKWKTF